MLSTEDVRALLGRVKYRDWDFHFISIGNGRGWLLWVTFKDDTGAFQKGRKWYISQHSCESEVVQTCLMAVLTEIEHEAREQFKFDGRDIYGPRLDANHLKFVKHQTREPHAKLHAESPCPVHGGLDCFCQPSGSHSFSAAACPACGDLDGCHVMQPRTY